MSRKPLIDHVGLYVSDYDKAKEFYTAVFGAVGAKLHMEITPPHTPEGEPVPANAKLTIAGKYVAGYGYDTPDFWVTNCENDSISPTHIAFSCSDHANVDKFYEAAIAAGAKCNGKPGLRPQYHPNYYAAFLIDADGHRIEAVCHHPA